MITAQTLQPFPIAAIDTRIEHEVQRALALHQHGKHADAEPIYQQILQHDPAHFDAMHLLGLVKAQTKSLNEAEALFRQAIRVKPEFAPAHFNIAKVLKNLNRLAEAIESFKIAIHLNPKYAEAHLGLGKVFLDTNNFCEALKCFENVMFFQPNNTDAIFYKGVTLQQLLQFDAALAAYSSVIQMKSRHPYAHMNRATVLKKLGRWEDALTGYETAQKITPANAEIFYNKGLLLHEMGRRSEAREAFDQSVLLDSGQIKYFHSRAKIHYDLESYESALDDYTHVLSSNAHHLEALLNIGAVYQRLNKYGSAIQVYKKAIDIDPLYSEALYNLSLAELSIGDFNSGWDHYEGRLQETFFRKASLADALDLSAEFSIRNLRRDLEGKTIFVAAEQGIGDHIMFLSMLPDLSEDADRIICQIDERLITIFSRCFPKVTFVPIGDVHILESIRADRFIRMGSLGYTYRRDMSAFAGTPYLEPDAARVAQWRARLPFDPKKKTIGVSWRGGTELTDGKDRSLTLAELAPLLDREDCHFISVQHGEVEAEVAAFNATRIRQLICFSKQEINDFEDLASLIAALDCVISVDNTNVHLGGALGKSCFAMLPFKAQWRYGATGASMPWYRSVKLIRQQEPRQWNEVIHGVNAAISDVLGRVRPEQ